jgi:hypothetical protein
MQTLAAILNGWDCRKVEETEEDRLCGQLYADVALFFVAVVLTYAAMILWCYLKGHRKRGEGRT